MRAPSTEPLKAEPAPRFTHFLLGREQPFARLLPGALHFRDLFRGQPGRIGVKADQPEHHRGDTILLGIAQFLFALLLLSNLVISYTNLFRNRETAFLLSLPVSTQTIFRWKFIESTLLASWAFLFLIAPLLAAFGLVRGVPWHFYFVTIFLIGLFIMLPGVIGAALAILIGRFLSGAIFRSPSSASAIALLAFAAFWWKTQAVDDELLDKRTLEALDQLLAKTRFTMFPFLPRLALVGGAPMGGRHRALTRGHGKMSEAAP